MIGWAELGQATIFWSIRSGEIDRFKVAASSFVTPECDVTSESWSWLQTTVRPKLLTTSQMLNNYCTKDYEVPPRQQ